MGEMMSKIPKLVLEKQLRDGRNYKFVEIANEIGISDTMIARFIRDEVDVSKMAFSTAVAWSKWLECDVLDLYQEVE